MEPGNRAIPIFMTNGEVGAYLVYPYLFNPQGEWIGWVAQDRNVYSVLGVCIGYMSDDPRILRKRGPGPLYERQNSAGPPSQVLPAGRPSPGPHDAGIVLRDDRRSDG